MKKLSIFLLIIIISCKQNCTDCGPLTTGSYFIENSTLANLQLKFYGSALAKYKNDSMELVANERKMIFYNSTGKPTSSILDLDLIMYDSVTIFTNEGRYIKSFYKEQCNDNQNMLCRSNYIKIKEEKEKSLTNIEYNLIIK